MEYHKQVLKCDHTFKEGKGFGEIGLNPSRQGGKCEFCGHTISWRWHIIDETGKQWGVGSNCVFNLLNIEKQQQRSYKAIMSKLARLKRSQKKYGHIVKYLQQNCEYITTGQKLVDKGLVTINELEYPNKLPNGEVRKWRAYFVPYRTNYGWTDREKELFLKDIFCDSHIGKESVNCRGCIASAIIRKVNKVGTLNNFWLNKYRETYDTNLPLPKGVA